MKVRAYMMNARGHDWSTLVNHVSRGKAKAGFYRDVREIWPEIRFIDVTCRSLGPAQPTPEFVRIAHYREVPFAYPGMKVRVGICDGLLIGAGSSANFRVYFTSGKLQGLTLTCHPESEIEYFDAEGQHIAAFAN